MILVKVISIYSMFYLSLLNIMLNRGKMLTTSQLKKLGEHKYQTENTSLLDPFFQPYWNRVVCYIPKWVAPNLITVTGLLVNIITAVTLILYSLDGATEAPRWTYFLCSVGLFVYQTLDAIDGKQARLTGTSSPLGELFDHGCDSISSVFVVMSVCIALQLGDFPVFMYFIYFLGLTAFYCAHWQTYVSGTFRFGKVDVTEAQLSIILVHMVTALFGADIWRKRLFSSTLCEMRILLSSVAIIGCFYMIYNVFKIILSGGSGKNGSTVAGTSIFSPGIPLLLAIYPGTVIAYNSISQIYQQEPVIFIILFGMVSAKVTNKLVVAHMTKSEIEYWDSCMLGPLALLLNQYFNYIIPEKFLLYTALIFAVYDLIVYCRRVCSQICTYLRIKLFSIPNVKTPPVVLYFESRFMVKGKNVTNGPSKIMKNRKTCQQISQ